jgi:hypothetical protein
MSPRAFAFVHIKKEFIGIDVRPALPLKDKFVVPWHGRICCRRIYIRSTSNLEDAKPLLGQCYRFSGKRGDLPPS